MCPSKVSTFPALVCLPNSDSRGAMTNVNNCLPGCHFQTSLSFPLLSMTNTPSLLQAYTYPFLYPKTHDGAEKEPYAIIPGYAVSGMRCQLLLHAIDYIAIYALHESTCYYLARSPGALCVRAASVQTCSSNFSHCRQLQGKKKAKELTSTISVLAYLVEVCSVGCASEICTNVFSFPSRAAVSRSLHAAKHRKKCQCMERV